MAAAELVLTGTVLTMDDAKPVAEAIAVAGGRILAVGGRAEIESLIGPGTTAVDVGTGAILPGFIEPHGHPLMESLALSDRIVDVRPVTVSRAEDVVTAVHREVADRGADGAYLIGWDALLQVGLPQPTLAWLDSVAPEWPLVIVHNSGHKAFFNSKAAATSGLTRATPDPKGGRYGRDGAGELDGTAEEIPAVFPLLDTVMAATDMPSLLAQECARLNRAGLTTCSEMAFDPAAAPLLEAMHDHLTVRIRTYERSNPQMRSAATPGAGDDVVRQVGIKVFVDGSPWIGNIDMSFPYLDTEVTRSIGVTPGSCGCANYTRDQLAEIVNAYFPQGWQMACHVHGDAGVDMILDVIEDLLARHPREDHRFRLEHVGLIRPDQLQRAADLGVTCTMFIAQIHYWGDVLVDGLFGPERGSTWMPAATALATGMRISMHNDAPVTPTEPLRNVAVAMTRKASSGRVLAPQERLTLHQALRAQTIDAAWHLFCDDIVGSLEVGKYADLVVLGADPRAVEPEAVADIDVRATYLAGRQVYRA